MRQANNAKSKIARVSSIAKGSDGAAIRQNYWDRPINDQDRNGQAYNIKRFTSRARSPSQSLVDFEAVKGERRLLSPPALVRIGPAH